MDDNFQEFTMSGVTQLLKQFAADESGATAVEYSLIVSLIFLAVVGVVQSVATKTTSMYGVIEAAM